MGHAGKCIPCKSPQSVINRLIYLEDGRHPNHRNYKKPDKLRVLGLTDAKLFPGRCEQLLDTWHRRNRLHAGKKPKVLAWWWMPRFADRVILDTAEKRLVEKRLLSALPKGLIVVYNWHIPEIATGRQRQKGPDFNFIFSNVTRGILPGLSRDQKTSHWGILTKAMDNVVDEINHIRRQAGKHLISTMADAKTRRKKPRNLRLCDQLACIPNAGDSLPALKLALTELGYVYVPANNAGYVRRRSFPVLQTPRPKQRFRGQGYFIALDCLLLEVQQAIQRRKENKVLAVTKPSPKQSVASPAPAPASSAPSPAPRQPSMPRPKRTTSGTISPPAPSTAPKKPAPASATKAAPVIRPSPSPALTSPPIPAQRPAPAKTVAAPAVRKPSEPKAPAKTVTPPVPSVAPKASVPTLDAAVKPPSAPEPKSSAKPLPPDTSKTPNPAPPAPAKMPEVTQPKPKAPLAQPSPPAKPSTRPPTAAVFTANTERASSTPAPVSPTPIKPVEAKLIAEEKPPLMPVEEAKPEPSPEQQIELASNLVMRVLRTITATDPMPQSPEDCTALTKRAGGELLIPTGDEENVTLRFKSEQCVVNADVFRLAICMASINARLPKQARRVERDQLKFITTEDDGSKARNVWLWLIEINLERIQNALADEKVQTVWTQAFQRTKVGTGDDWAGPLNQALTTAGVAVDVAKLIVASQVPTTISNLNTLEAKLNVLER